MNNKSSGGGIAAVVIIIIGIIIFLISRNSLSALFRTLGWIFLIIVALGIIALVLIIIFAARQSKDANGNTNLSSSKARLTDEQQAVINDGRADLMALRRKLVTIKNNDIRSKGNEVCSSMDRVFKILKEKPEKIPDTRQFLNYYLPTVSKVISKYQRLEANEVPAEDMTGKIKSFLDDVDDAMDQQCSHLYEDDKLDMSVNMEALTMAIKRDGLLDDNDFPAKQE